MASSNSKSVTSDKKEAKKPIANTKTKAKTANKKSGKTKSNKKVSSISPKEQTKNVSGTSKVKDITAETNDKLLNKEDNQSKNEDALYQIRLLSNSETDEKTSKQADKSAVDLKYSIAVWYKQILATNNECFVPLFSDHHRYLVLCGGGGSGKSIFAGRKLLERVTSETGHRFLVCRKVARTLRESCYKQLISQLNAHYPDCKYTDNKTDMLIRFDNDNEIIFAGLDDTEKLKSIYGVTGMWIEEASEITEQDFNQLDIRLRGESVSYKQIIVTFNPVSILSWLKLRFFDKVDDRVTTHRSTYKDNRFLDDEAKKVLESFRESDEYYYTVYCLGEWGVTGKSVFNARAVTERIQQKIRPIKTGYFEFFDTSYNFIEDSQTYIVKIFSDPIEGVPYVIGGDTAGQGSDSFVGQVIDNRNGNQVAVLRHTADEDLYAKQMFCLGKYFNTALIGIETNYSTYPVMELERLKYPKQYVRETIDDYTHKPKQSYGFRTTAQSRPVIIAGLVSALRDDMTKVSDETTLQEMLTFVRNEDFRAEAENGAHDDCIISLAIAHFIRPQQSTLAIVKEGNKVKWTKDMWEDYSRATADEKAYLIRKWGTPRR